MEQSMQTELVQVDEGDSRTTVDDFDKFKLIQIVVRCGSKWFSCRLVPKKRNQTPSVVRKILVGVGSKRNSEKL
jgi:hypothetical protein